MDTFLTRPRPGPPAPVVVVPAGTPPAPADAATGTPAAATGPAPGSKPPATPAITAPAGNSPLSRRPAPGLMRHLPPAPRQRPRNHRMPPHMQDAGPHHKVDTALEAGQAAQRPRARPLRGPPGRLPPSQPKRLRDRTGM